MEKKTKEHYDNHLSNFYSWMFGDYDSFVTVQENVFRKHHLETPKNTNIAFDLGCGSGFQSVALTNFGYKVHAIDFSAPLLEELKQKSNSVDTYVGDLTDLNFAGSVVPELIVCMGDTLTHLHTKEIVQKLIIDSFGKLAEGGVLLFTYRDLSRPRNPEDRFIPVKSDNDRILTCFLEDLDSEKIRVFDLLYERNAESNKWELKKSFYEKLKLPSAEVIQWLTTAGFRVHHETTPSGLEVVVATKP